MKKMVIHCSNIIVLDKLRKPKYGRRCDVCNKIAPVSAVFTCACGKKSLCIKHRLPEDHNCSFQFKYDSSKMVGLSAPKLVRID